MSINEHIAELSILLRYPSTLAFDVSACLPGDDHVMYDCANGLRTDEDRSTGQVSHRAATSEEQETILKWLTDNPPRPSSLTPLQILSFLTDAEEDAIIANARRLSRELFTAIEPVSYARFAEAMTQLSAAGLVSPERLTQILACQTVE